MRRTIGAAATLAALLAVPAVAAEEARKVGPRVEMESTEVDVGEIVRGHPAEGEFVLRNVGDDVLRILSAKPG